MKLRRHQLWEITKQVPGFLGLLLVYSPRGLWRLGAVVKRFLVDQETADLALKHAGNAETAEWEKVQKRRAEKLRARWWASAVSTVLVSAVPLAYLAPWVLAGLVGVLATAGIVVVIPGKTIWEYIAGALAGVGVAWGLHQALLLLPPLPAWPLIVLGALSMFALGWVGRPDDRSLVKAATPLTGDRQRITAPYVIDALCRIGIKGLDMPREAPAPAKTRTSSGSR